MLNPEADYDIPNETQRVACAAFPNGNPYMRLRDELGHLYEDEAFAPLFSSTGQPALASWRLAWVTVLQFAEGLTDRQAGDAMRVRIDWKYVLGLPLEDAGFNYSVLSEFRARLASKGSEAILLERVLERARECQWLKAGGRQRTDSTHVLAAINQLNRLELVEQTLQRALNALARQAPEWLQRVAPVVWWDRYAKKLDDYRLPKKESERRALAEVIGQDGWHLLALVNHPEAPPDLARLEALAILEQVWREQHHVDDDEGGPRWRANAALPASADRIASPHDPDARYSVKRDIEWQGYKAHLTGICEPGAPHLIVNVETTVATTQDVDALDAIHQGLDRQRILPNEHLVDSGYVSADQLIRSQQDYAINLIGPVRLDVSWQAQQPDAYDVAPFQIDWDTEQATCPQGKISSYWKPQTGVRDNPVIEINFRGKDCRPCPARASCTRSKNGPSVLTLMPRDQFEALQAARVRQQMDAFKAQCQTRAGVEGTIGQAVNPYAMRRARYRSLAKTRLQHIATATGINLQRLSARLTDIPVFETRVSAFASLAPRLRQQRQILDTIQTTIIGRYSVLDERRVESQDYVIEAVRLVQQHA